MSDLIKCPDCGHDLRFETMEKIKDKCRYKFELVPGPSELFRAETIGGVLTQFAKLARSIAKDRNMARVLIVEKITTGEDGRITVDLLECSPADAKKIKAAP